MNSTTRDWNDGDKKSAAILKVLRYIIDHPGEGQDRVGRDLMAHELFRRAGKIDIPEEDGARVVFFAAGEKKKEAGASVIIELPPITLTDSSKVKDEELFNYVLGNYEWWGSLKKAER